MPTHQFSFQISIRHHNNTICTTTCPSNTIPITTHSLVGRTIRTMRCRRRAQWPCQLNDSRTPRVQGRATDQVRRAAGELELRAAFVSTQHLAQQGSPTGCQRKISVHLISCSFWGLCHTCDTSVQRTHAFVRRRLKLLGCWRCVLGTEAG